jgi:predicted RNase H-like HicB family nuclease
MSFGYTNFTMQVTAVLRQEGKLVTSFCPELDVASQGATFDEARNNLREAVELLLDVASDEEMKGRYQSQSS